MHTCVRYRLSLYVLVKLTNPKNLHTVLLCYSVKPGHARFEVHYTYNRKGNVIDLEIRQDVCARGALKYAVWPSRFGLLCTLYVK